jgi:WD40 repeat protein
LALSLEGQFLAGASADGALTIWNLEGGDILYATTLRGMPSGWVFLPDGFLAVELSGDPLEHIELWNVVAGYRTDTFEWTDRAGPIYFVTFSPDGTTAAWVSRASVLLMDMGSGDERALLGHEDFVSEAVFAPHSAILATTSAAEVDDEFMAVIDLWDAESGEKLRTIVHGEAAVRVAFSPDGSLLASATYDGVIRLWDLSSGELLKEFEGEQDRVFRLFFAHGGRLLVCASWEGPIGIWAVQE